MSLKINEVLALNGLTDQLGSHFQRSFSGQDPTNVPDGSTGMPSGSSLQPPAVRGEPVFVPGEFIVQFKSGFQQMLGAGGLTQSALARDLAQSGATVVEDLSSASHPGVALVRVTNPVALDAVMTSIGKRADVEFVEHNWVYSIDALRGENSIDALSNDPGYSDNLWGMYGDAFQPPQPYGSQAEESWNSGAIGTSKTVVGIIDSGTDYTHPDLYQNIWLNQKEISPTLRATLTDTDGDGNISFVDLNATANVASVKDKNGNYRIDAGDLLQDSRWENGVDEDDNGYTDDLIGWDFVNNDNDPMDDNEHGTHVAGTIGATGGNGIGVAGVNWKVQMMPLKFLSWDGNGSTDGATAAVNYYTAASLASGTNQNFIGTNNSWGGGDYSTVLKNAIEAGAVAGNLFVAAAGNEGYNNDQSASYPSGYNTTLAAGYDAVIAVAAINSTGKLASFSQYGAATVDLAAPGVDILSTIPNGGYARLDGTSMATPYVTGALALYASEHPGVSANEIRTQLLNSTTDTASLDSKTVTGGRLDVSAMLGSGVVPRPNQPLFLIGTSGADTFAGGSNNDEIAGLAGNDSLAGAGGDDLIYGNDGNDVLNGGDGQDSLNGGKGNDALNGGNGHDAASFNLCTTVVTVSLLTGVATGEGSDTLTGIEDLVGSAYSDKLTGDTTDNYLWGYAGNDTLDGGDGADVLYGNEGSDVLNGGIGGDALYGASGNDILNGGDGDDGLIGHAGNDQFNGGNGYDTVYFFNSSVAVTASLLTGQATGEGNDTLTGIENLYGSYNNDILTGNSGANILDGWGGPTP